MSKHFLHFFFSFTFFFHFFSGRNKKIQKCLTCDTHTHSRAPYFSSVALYTTYTQTCGMSPSQSKPTLPSPHSQLLSPTLLESATLLCTQLHAMQQQKRPTDRLRSTQAASGAREKHTNALAQTSRVASNHRQRDTCFVSTAGIDAVPVPPTEKRTTPRECKSSLKQVNKRSAQVRALLTT